MLFLLVGLYLSNAVVKEKKMSKKGEEQILWNLVLFFLVLLFIAQMVNIVSIFSWFTLPGGSGTVHLIIIAALLYKLLTTQKKWKIE